MQGEIMEEHKHEHYNNDGIDNKEHLLDLVSECEMLLENITDNTDTAFMLIKENEKDEDIVDAIKIDASEILEIEKFTNGFKEKINAIKLYGSEKDLELKEELDGIFQTLEKYEEKSNKILEKLIKKSK
jgi:hypothetical protein